MSDTQTDKGQQLIAEVVSPLDVQFMCNELRKSADRQRFRMEQQAGKT